MLFLKKEHLKWKSTYRLRTRLSATRFSGRRSITSSTKPNSLASSGDMKWSLSILDSAVCNKESQSSQAKTHPIHMSFSYIDIYKCENTRFSCWTCKLTLTFCSIFSMCRNQVMQKYASSPILDKDIWQ